MRSTRDARATARAGAAPMWGRRWPPERRPRRTEYPDGFLLPAESGQHGAECDPGDDVALQGRIGLPAGRALGRCQHRGRIGACPRVVRCPQDGRRSCEAAPCLVRRVVVLQAGLGDVGQSGNSLQLTALRRRNGHTDCQRGSARMIASPGWSPRRRYVAAAPCSRNASSADSKTCAARCRCPAAVSRRTASSTCPAARYQSVARTSSSGRPRVRLLPAHGSARPGRAGGIGTTRSEHPLGR